MNYLFVLILIIVITLLIRKKVEYKLNIYVNKFSFKTSSGKGTQELSINDPINKIEISGIDEIRFDNLESTNLFAGGTEKNPDYMVINRDKQEHPLTLTIKGNNLSVECIGLPDESQIGINKTKKKNRIALSISNNGKAVTLRTGKSIEIQVKNGKIIREEKEEVCPYNLNLDFMDEGTNCSLKSDGNIECLISVGDNFRTFSENQLFIKVPQLNYKNGKTIIRGGEVKLADMGKDPIKLECNDHLAIKSKDTVLNKIAWDNKAQQLTVNLGGSSGSLKTGATRADKNRCPALLFWLYKNPAIGVPALLIFAVITFFIGKIDSFDTLKKAFANHGNYCFINEFKKDDPGIFVAELAGDENSKCTRELVAKLNEIMDKEEDLKDSLQIKILPITIRNIDIARKIGENKNASLVIFGEINEDIESKGSDKVVRTTVAIIKSNSIMKQGTKWNITDPEDVCLPDQYAREPVIMARFIMGFYYYEKAGRWNEELLKKAADCFERTIESIEEIENRGRKIKSIQKAGVNFLAGNSNLFLGEIRERNIYAAKAIVYFENAIKFYEKGKFPQNYAGTQNNLGTAYFDLPTGDRGENIRKTIKCYEEALSVYEKGKFPQEYAMIQNNLGQAYSDLPTRDRGENINKAIECYEEALSIRTKKKFPQEYAMTQNNLGNAYFELPTGDRGENIRKAIECYEETLSIRTKKKFPQEYAMTQSNLGNVYSNLPTGDRRKNLKKAIECYNEALSIRTKKKFPQDYATTQDNLGNVYSDLPTGDRRENIRKAIECYEEALSVYEKDKFPQYYARTQNNLGLVYFDLSTGDRGENIRKAIECYGEALSVYEKGKFPQYYATTQNNLGLAYSNLPTGDRGDSIRKAIECYEEALSVYEKGKFPQYYAMTQNNLGNAYFKLPTGDRGENIRKAIQCYNEALSIYTIQSFPHYYKMTIENLEEAKMELKGFK